MEVSTINRIKNTFLESGELNLVLRETMMTVTGTVGNKVVFVKYCPDFKVFFAKSCKINQILFSR